MIHAIRVSCNHHPGISTCLDYPIFHCAHRRMTTKISSSTFSHHHPKASSTRSRLGRTSLDQDNITVLDDVVLAFGHDLTLGLDCRFVAKLLQYFVVVDDTLDEGLFEITVDNTSGLWCLGTVPECPLSDLIGTGCEERTKVEDLAHGGNDLGQGRLGLQLLALLQSGGLGVEGGQALLEADRDWDDGVARSVLLDPFSDAWEMLVLLADVVLLAQVDEVDNWLGGKEEERVDDLDLLYVNYRSTILIRLEVLLKEY